MFKNIVQKEHLTKNQQKERGWLKKYTINKYNNPTDRHFKYYSDSYFLY